jgi:hypothetical protein
MDHAAECPACGGLAARYQLLRRALQAWDPPPAAPRYLADRILAATRIPQARPWVGGSGPGRWLRRIGLPLAAVAAAAAAVLIVVTSRNATDQPRPHGPALVAGVRSGSPRPAVGTSAGSVDAPPLEQALAEATEATWDLARSASEPAARISRQVLDAATQVEPQSAGPVGTSSGDPGADPGSPSRPVAVSVPSFGPLAPDPAAASAVLKQVGDSLASGFRPLSTTARHAFGFLLGPAVDKPGARTDAPAAKGA